jgi:hypothetical protein
MMGAMKTLKIAFLGLVAVLVLGVAACTTYQPPEKMPVKTSIDIDADFDATWSAVVETLAEIGISVKQMEKTSGYIEAETMSVKADWVDWGRLETLSSKVLNPTARFNLFVKSIATGRCSVKLTVTYQATEDVRRTDEPERRPLAGESTGKFEKTLFDSITDKISQ